MYLAIDQNGKKFRPQKNCVASCPVCKQAVVAKMGKIKVHHWAHKESPDCTYGRGMTEWHYQWIDRHFEKSGWQVEHIDSSRRYDCFNEEKQLVLEIQKEARYDYIIEKTNFVIEQGMSINWIFHTKIFKSFTKDNYCFRAKTFRHLVILDIIKMFEGVLQVNFYVDSLALSHEGKSSKGLLKLIPDQKSGYMAYFSVDFIPYQSEYNK